MLDNMQKAVLSCGVEYARALVICRTSKVPPDFYSGYAEAGSGDHLKKAGNLKNVKNVAMLKVTARHLSVIFISTIDDFDVAGLLVFVFIEKALDLHQNAKGHRWWQHRPPRRLPGRHHLRAGRGLKFLGCLLPIL